MLELYPHGDNTTRNGWVSIYISTLTPCTVGGNLRLDMNAKLQSTPDAMGRFGLFGGRYVPETLIEALNELTTEYEKACKDEAFQHSWGVG